MTEQAGIETSPSAHDAAILRAGAIAVEREICSGMEYELAADSDEAFASAIIDAVRPLIEAQFEPARRVDGTLQLWVHTCGNAEWHDISYPPNAAPPSGSLGGCDACESGSGDPTDWQPVYVKAVKR